MLTFTKQGMYCEAGDFYIDPWLPVHRAVITHGHGDHARTGMGQYLCQHISVPILRARLGQDIKVEGMSYGEVKRIGQVSLSFHPAGHVPGSSQVRLEYKGKICVVSGDYKTQNDGLATPFEVVKCHEFVSECTFGLPIYRWSPIEEQEEQLRAWYLRNKAQRKLSVFFGYSLGKAQRLMKAMEGVARIGVHASVARINQAYEEAGVRLPAYEQINLNEVSGLDLDTVLVMPPALLGTQALGKLPNRAEGYCSGWMQVRGARRWRSVDAGFAISDHADWSGLLDTIRATGAEKVYATHGQTAVFARYVKENLGIEAEEVKTVFGNEDDQLD